MNGGFRGFTFALALLALLSGFNACDQDKYPVSGTEIPGRGVTEGASGSARVLLPTLPQGYPGDSSLVDSGGQALFQLTISGPDMEPMRRTWLLYPWQTDPVVISGIPEGPSRIFSGRLVWMSAATGDTTVTHEGMDSVFIERGRVADVVLHLRKVNGGSASVCIQVEGWPSDSTCHRPPGPDTLLKKISGCWKVGFRGLEGSLRVEQTGKDLGGSLRWADGSVDSLSGILEYPYLRLTTVGANGTRRFKGNVLPAVDHFEVKLLDTPQGVVEKLVGDRGRCDSTGVPGDAVVLCWNVHQTLANGLGGPGTLWLMQSKSENVSRGLLTWDGYPAMMVGNESAPAFAPSLYLFGNFPAGMGGEPESAEHRGHYKASIMPDGSLVHGAIYRESVQGGFYWDGGFGEWDGTPTQCPDRVVAYMLQGRL
ncbi:MAG: hypothetical protein JWO30_794 [Fibrobacteres bacterium]|nr:hypothetical protein [Fibrobacterota bacterium]